MSFAEHALCRSAEPFNIFAMAQMISHCLPVASADLWPLDMNALMCDLPPVCRAQECLPAHRQRLIAFRWRQLDGSQLSPKLSCVVLTPKRFHHIHTCLPRCIQTARLSSFSARRLASVVIGRGLWGPMDFELQGGRAPVYACFSATACISQNCE